MIMDMVIVCGRSEKEALWVFLDGYKWYLVILCMLLDFSILLDLYIDGVFVGKERYLGALLG